MLQVTCCCVTATNEVLSCIACINLLILFNPQILLRHHESKTIEFVEIQCVQNIRAVS